MSTGQTKRLWLILLAAAGLLWACGTEDAGPNYPTTAKDTPDPSGKTTLSLLSAQKAEQALEAAEKVIDGGRVAGINLLITDLSAALQTAGIDVSAISKINDKYIYPDPNGSPAALPTTWTSTGSSSKSLTGIGEKQSGLTPPTYTTYFDCPLNTPETTEDTDCDKLVGDVIAAVQTKIESAKSATADTIAQTFPDLDGTQKEFVTAWAMEANQFGAKLAAAYAVSELKAAAKCDTHVNAMNVSYNLGTEQGVDMIVKLTPKALAQVTTCTTNTDLIADAIKAEALSTVDKFVTDTPICMDQDLSAVNDVFKAATDQRKKGILKGIDDQIAILRGQLFQRRAATPCPAPPRVGDPLVLDLNGDGVTLGKNVVSFDLLGDGAPAAVSWVGPGEGMVAIDLDQDGAIRGARELMSDRTICGDHRCADGVEALTQWDSAALGGNEDGTIDASDKVYGRLLLWTDRNQDGVSQADELTSLERAGVRAISLRAAYPLRSVGHGFISASLAVQSDRGQVMAHECWLGFTPGLENLRALAPR